MSERVTTVPKTGLQTSSKDKIVSGSFLNTDSLSNPQLFQPQNPDNLSKIEPKLEWKFILICSGAAIVLIALIIILILWIVKWYRRRRKNRQLNSSTTNTDLSNSLFEGHLEEKDVEAGKRDISGKTAFKSTVISKGIISSPSLLRRDLKHTDVSRASQFSINSHNNFEDDQFSDKLNFKNRTVIANRKSRNVGEKQSKSHELTSSDQQYNTKAKFSRKTWGPSEFSIDTFLEHKWERKRTHHSPDEVLRKPRRKSNWKCDLKDLNNKQVNMQYTLKKLGLEK